MKIIKHFIRACWCFAVKLKNTLLFLYRSLLYTDLTNHIKYEKKETYLTILANGPSLRDYLDRIDYSCGDYLVVNNFYKSPLYHKIKPKFLVLADPLFFTKDDDIKPFIESTNWNLKLFVPYEAYRKMGILRKMPTAFIDVVPYHYGHYHGFENLRHYIYKHGLSMPIAQNVLVPSIFNAINMGYKEIRLYGVDHSWTEEIRVNDKNEVCLTDSHFYDIEKSNLKPWYKIDHIYKMHEVLRDLAQMFDSYFELRKYADKENVRIFNYTKGSYIDAFERV